MCCTRTTPRYHCQDQPSSGSHNQNHCGCGCIGKSQTILGLENAKAGLKAELECIESRLANLRRE